MDLGGPALETLAFLQYAYDLLKTHLQKTKNENEKSAEVAGVIALSVIVNVMRMLTRNL